MAMNARSIKRMMEPLKLERKQLQLELALEQLSDNSKDIIGSFVSNGKKKARWCDVSVHQPSTADRQRIVVIQARLNDIYRELWYLEREMDRQFWPHHRRPILQWGKHLADVILSWI